jgi:hypothetical protein
MNAKNIIYFAILIVGYQFLILVRNEINIRIAIDEERVWKDFSVVVFESQRFSWSLSSLGDKILYSLNHSRNINLYVPLKWLSYTAYLYAAQILVSRRYGMSNPCLTTIRPNNKAIALQSSFLYMLNTIVPVLSKVSNLTSLSR